MKKIALQCTLRTALCAALLAAQTLAVSALPAVPLLHDSAAAGALAPDSIYQLSIPLTNQDGRTSLLAERRGHPILVSMFYTSCEFVCPMLIDAMRDTESSLSVEERGRLSVLMVSFDPAHDSVAVLRQKADERHLDGAHWTLARTDAANVRKLAAVLGVRYRALAGGEFNHTSELILVDAEGRILGRTARLGNADPAFVRRVRAAVAGPSH
ncbi:MAG: SCO family protein [Rudaea sp.]